MKKLWIFFYCLVFFMQVGLPDLVGKKMADVHMDELYKKIGDELVGIRKEYPACQSKVYVVLDQVDKMYNIAKTTNQKTDQLRISLKNKEFENTALNNEVIALRGALESTHGKLEASYKSLELEKKQAAKLAEEKNALVNKEKKKKENEKKSAKSDQGPKDTSVAGKALAELSELEQQQIAKSQSLNLISTSEPSSPR